MAAAMMIFFIILSLYPFWPVGTLSLPTVRAIHNPLTVWMARIKRAMTVID
jgi:hypothetical protein